MNKEKKYLDLGKSLLSGPYLVWMTGFTIIPLLMILWYGLTGRDGAFTLENILSIAEPDHMKALVLSLGLSLISTLLCLFLAYPLAMILRGRGNKAGSFIVFIFILPMWMNFLLRTLAWQTLLEKNGVINGILSFSICPVSPLSILRQLLYWVWYTTSCPLWFFRFIMYLPRLTTALSMRLRIWEPIPSRPL